MKRNIFLFAIFFTIFIIGLAYYITQLNGREDTSKAWQLFNNKPTLPASLDNFYPPKVKQPVYLLRMFEMATPVSAIFVDLMENDVENVKADYELFKKKYLEMSKLIPEWESSFPVAPVDELGIAIGSGDQGKVMAAFEKVGKICHGCHIENMVPVMQKYHWLDFKSIKGKDPLTNEEINFSQMMQFMEMGFSGFMVNLQRGRKDAAIKNFQAFKARFNAFKEFCFGCHNSERKYYVDEEVDALINELEKKLNADTINPEEIQRLAMTIGEESCRKCHLVHLPAAYSKY